MRLFLKEAIAVGTLLATALTAGCGSSSDASSKSGGGGKPTLTITSPSDNADVRNPVTITFNASVPIGPTNSGKDHVHVFVDGKTNDYQVVTSTTHQLTNLAPGKHTIGVTLQHADHSAAGAKAQVTVNVTGGAGGPASPSNSTGYDKPGYGY